MPQAFSQKNYNVVINGPKVARDYFGDSCKYIADSNYITEYFIFKRADLVFSDNNLRRDFIPKYKDTILCYVPHGSVGLLERLIDLGLSDDSIQEIYNQHLINSFDYFLIPNQQIHELFSLLINGLPHLSPKHLIKSGYVNLDKLIPQGEELRQDAILYTVGAIPSGNYYRSDYMSFPDHSISIIRALLQNFKDKNIIFRPHPASIDHPEFRENIQAIKNEFSEFPNFIFDTDKDQSKSYSRSLIAVSDSSSTAFSFAYSRLRPVCFFFPEKVKDTSTFFNHKFNTSRHHIGLTTHSIPDLIMGLKKLLDNLPESSKKILEHRNNSYYNISNVENFIISTTKDILSKKI